MSPQCPSPTLWPFSRSARCSSNLIGQIVFVDVANVLDRLPTDLFGDNDLVVFQRHCVGNFHSRGDPRKICREVQLLFFLQL